MNKYITLTKILLKNGSDSSFKNRKKVKTLFLMMIIMAAFLPMAVTIFIGTSNGYDMLKQINQQGILLGFGFSISSLIIFVFGIFFVMNVFYFSKDIETLLSLPLKPRHILGAKFTVTLIYEYLTEVIIIIPILISYGIKDSAGIIYYIYSIIVFLILPIIPIAMAAFVNMIIMRFSNMAKNKDRFKIIGGILGMFFAIGINMYMQKISTVPSTPEQIKNLLMSGNNSMLGIATRLFPTSKIAALSVVNHRNVIGIINLLLFLTITIGFIALFISIGEVLYFKGVMGISETSASRKILNASQYAKYNKQSSSIRSYTAKELKILFRTPVYFINCILMNFLWPVFIMLPIVVNKESRNAIVMIQQFLRNDQMNGIIVVSACAVGLFITSTNCITSTAISREGDNLYFTKYIPVNGKEQLIGKTMPGVIMGLVGTLAILVVLLVVSKFKILIVVSIILSSIFGIIFSSLVGILIDLNFPKLKWDNEQKAVKQNINTLICMLICTVIAGLIVFISIKMRLTLITAFSGIVIVFGILDYVLYRILCKWGVRIFETIEW